MLASGHNQIDLNPLVSLDRLDDYSLLNVFDLLEFDDLANMATISRRYQQLIIQHYIIPTYGLNQSVILIYISDIEEKTTIFYLPTGEYEDRINLRSNRRSILSVLEAFCPLFSRLIIDSKFVFDIDVMHEVAESANIHCVSIPQKIGIDIPLNKSVNLTFQNAKEIFLRHGERRTAIELDRMFPRMESVTIGLHERIAWNHNFPYLKFVDLVGNYNQLFDLKSFGEQNQQIRGLRIRLNWNPEHLQQVSEIFPNLEYLHIKIGGRYGKSSENDLLSRFRSFLGLKRMIIPRFLNVIRFTMDLSHMFSYSDDWTQHNQPLIQFDQLKTFKLVTNSWNLIDNQIDLVTQNRKLLYVDFSSITLSYAQMIRLVEALPNLEEITLKCVMLQTVEDILSLMQNTNLQSINVIVYSETRSVFLGMTTLPANWSLYKKKDGATVKSITFKRNYNNIV